MQEQTSLLSRDLQRQSHHSSTEHLCACATVEVWLASSRGA